MPRVRNSASSVQEYFESIPAERREALGTLRGLIRQVWPKVEERMDNGMPSYALDGIPFCAIANQKNFMVLYIMPYDLLVPFKNDLKVHDTGKSCIRFKRLDAEVLVLFDRIIKYTGSQLHLSVLVHGGGKRTNGQRR